MADYIKREDAIFIILQRPFFQNSMATEIRQVCGIDIVQCGKCRYCKMKRTAFKGEPLLYYKCELLEREVEYDDYCSWGEEK